MDERAQKWKDRLLPLQGERWPIRCGQRLDPEELGLLREGLWPRDMDDRWVIWLEGDTLRCWRSWTGSCIYEAQVTVGDDGHGLVAVVDVLDCPEAYRRAASDEAELQRFEGVLGLPKQARDWAAMDGSEMAGIRLVSDTDGARTEP